MYAIDYDILRYENRIRIQSELFQQLNREKLWSLDKGEKIEAPNYLSVQGADKAPKEVFIQSIGPASRLARFIKHEYRKAGAVPPNGEGHTSMQLFYHF